MATGLPLRWRLTLAFAAGMALVLVALALFLQVRLRADLTESIDEGLSAQAQFVSAAADRGAPLSSGGTIVDADGALAQIIDASGRVSASASPLAAEPFLSPRRSHRSATGCRPSSRPRRRASVNGCASWRSRVKDGSIVVVARTLDDRDEALSRLLIELTLGGTVALALSTFLGWVLAGAALRPVERMRRDAEAISVSEPERRLSVPEPDDELRRLAETLNSMLERLQASMQTERAFLDRASHELRTPLTVLKGELDLALARPRTPQELERALRRSSQEVEILVRLAEDLLVLSREQQGRLPMRRKSVRLDELVKRLAPGFASRAGPRVLTSRCGPSPGWW